MTDEFKELQSVVREFCDGHLNSAAHTTVEMPEGQGKKDLLVEIMKRIMALEGVGNNLVQYKIDRLSAKLDGQLRSLRRDFKNSA